MTNIAAPADDSGFCDSDKLKRVIIREGIRKIKMVSFADCNSLESISIPSSVTEISESAFIGCWSLTNINVDDCNAQYTSIDGVLLSKDQTKLIIYPLGKSYNVSDVGAGGKMETLDYSIPDGVTSIGFYAFKDCFMDSVVLPNSVTEIGNMAFSGCRYLKHITLPEGIKTIGREVFKGCESLEEIIIPESVTEIDHGAFKGNTALKDITIPDGVTGIGYEVFSGCSSLTRIILPNSIKSIDKKAFNGCLSLTGIDIPASVTRIDISAFNGCESLKSITVDEKNPFYYSIGGVLFDKNNSKKLFTPHVLLSNRTSRIINSDDLAMMTDEEIISEISVELGLDYEVKPEIWEYGFCGEGPQFEVTFEGEHVVQLGSIRMTTQTLELCAGLKSLEVLNICYTEVDMFPEALCKLSKLKLLNLYGTKITKLPDSIGKLTALEELQFGCTEITELPDTVCNLSQLKILRAQHSRFSRLPENIGKLTNLKELDIHYSHVNELPQSLANCTKLESLWWRFVKNDPKIPEAVTANIMRNFGTTSGMSAFARFRNNCHNKDFIVQIVIDNTTLLQIWNEYDRLLEIDEDIIRSFVGGYLDIWENGERGFIYEACTTSGIDPLLDENEEFVPKNLGTRIFSSKYLSSCGDISQAEMECWIPQMYEFYCLDKCYCESYPDFYNECKEWLDGVFKK